MGKAHNLTTTLGHCHVIWVPKTSWNPLGTWGPVMGLMKIRSNVILLRTLHVFCILSYSDQSTNQISDGCCSSLLHKSLTSNIATRMFETSHRTNTERPNYLKGFNLCKNARRKYKTGTMYLIIDPCLKSFLVQ